MYHPELRNAWGDLKTKMKVVQPKKAEQPSNLKVTLLPFQQESLYWMRKQEFGSSAGGMLAVRTSLTVTDSLVLTVSYLTG